MIGRNGERRSGISAQAARHDDDVTNASNINSATKNLNIQIKAKIDTENVRSQMCCKTLFFKKYSKFFIVIYVWTSTRNTNERNIHILVKIYHE